ncbi:hypothetical protein [Microbulbifer sp. JMSA003]|uniref:hypothetical protein n=1 Tax=Microbulbifer sp. JMSA003 TaxID=3243369 RepID=UPI00403967FD
MSDGVKLNGSSAAIRQERAGGVENQRDRGKARLGRIGAMLAKGRQVLAKKLGFTQQRGETPTPARIVPGFAPRTPGSHPLVEQPGDAGNPADVSDDIPEAEFTNADDAGYSVAKLVTEEASGTNIPKAETVDSSEAGAKGALVAKVVGERPKNYYTQPKEMTTKFKVKRSETGAEGAREANVVGEGPQKYFDLPPGLKKGFKEKH